jgi:hypothetical protein
LQTYSKNWLPLLFTAFINAKTGHRAPLANTIAAYAAISEQSLLTGLFHTTLKKFLKVKLSSLPFLPYDDHLCKPASCCRQTNGKLPSDDCQWYSIGLAGRFSVVCGGDTHVPGVCLGVGCR